MIEAAFDNRARPHYSKSLSTIDDAFDDRGRFDDAFALDDLGRRDELLLGRKNKIFRNDLKMHRSYTRHPSRVGFLLEHHSIWPRGPMDKASAYGARD